MRLKGSLRIKRTSSWFVTSQVKRSIQAFLQPPPEVVKTKWASNILQAWHPCSSEPPWVAHLYFLHNRPLQDIALLTLPERGRGFGTTPRLETWGEKILSYTYINRVGTGVGMPVGVAWMFNQMDLHGEYTQIGRGKQKGITLHAFCLHVCHMALLCLLCLVMGENCLFLPLFFS